MKYIIERFGDIKGITIHKTFNQALEHLDREFPKDEDGERCSPDPEDDRILIWEIADGGYKKVVWHFSGWHWNSEEFGLPQGELKGDGKSLYNMVNN